MNHRLTIAAAIAVILASTSEWVLINGGGWLAASMGAVVVVALAGTLTRMAPTQAAIGATALATLASVPLLVDRSLWLKLAGVIVIGCCAASASRARLLRPVADFVTYLSALLLYLNLILSGGKSFALLIPTARSLHHLTVLVSNGSQLAGGSPPVPGTAGVILLAAGSIGLAAIAVDVIAVRLRKPAIAGLPLLVIYMAPIATVARIGGASGILTFLLASVGYLGLLGSDGRHRLRGWGRIVTVWHYAGEDERLGGADIRGLAATGRKIGFAAICAAIVAPLVLPSLSLHRLFGNNGGGSHVVVTALPDPVDQMHALLNEANNAPVLTYKSTSKTGVYLQVYVLNYNPGQGNWTLVPPTPSASLRHRAPLAPQGLAPTTNYAKTVTTIKLDHVTGSSDGYNFPVFFLPVPYWATALNVPGSWSESYNSLMIYSGNAHHSGMQYTAISGQPVLTKALEALPESMPKAISKNYLGYKSSATKQLTAIAREITKKATTPFEKAQALEDFFQSGKFTYTLHANLPNTGQGVLDFLTKDRQGFCEQFAFAMAVLARLVGIPSRIAIGYTGGSQHSGGSIWHVTTSDAHSWPELYFPQIGWLRFEPTPGGPRGQGTASQPSYGIPSSNSGPGGTVPPGKSFPSNPYTGVAKGGTHLKVPPLDAGGGAPPPIRAAASHSPVPIGQIFLGLLALLIVASAIPGTTRIVTRRRRWRGAADDTALATAAWQEVCADLEDFGLSRRLSESPRATAKRVSVDTNIDDGAKRAISRIATVVEQCKYAPVPASAHGIEADVTEVRRSLARNSSIIKRLRARLYPASVVDPMFDAMQQTVGQRTGWLPSPIQS
jgi:transglutaminase-like putative cysteine protease